MTSTEKFLQAEEGAEQLVETLRALMQETTSYGNAATELHDAQTQLSRLVSATQDAAVGTQEVIRQLKSIGTAELIEHIDAIERNSIKHFEETGKLGQAIVERLDGVATEISSVQKALRDLRTPILGAVALSAIAVVLGLIGLIR